MNRATRVLLAHAYTLADDPREQEIMRPFPPLGLQYLAASLAQPGAVTVEIWDPTFGSLTEFASVLDRVRPDVVGFYGHTLTRPKTVTLVSQAKARGITVIAGGPDPVQYLEAYFDMGCDIVVIGEGELTLADLVAGRPAEDTPGVAFRRDGVVVRTPARALVKKLDTLPWPRRDRADLQAYFNAWRARHGETAMSMTTSRGCPYHCTWCSKQVYGDTFRRREPDAVIDEMQHLRHTYGPDQLWFVDDMFTINKKWVQRFCERVVARNAQVPFYVIGRPETLTDSLVAGLRAAGCYRMYVSAESGAQHVLDAMKKESTVAEILDGGAILRKHGIELGVFTMLGYPGEAKADILATRDMLRTLLPEVTLLSVAHPMKGTAFYDAVSNEITGESGGRLTFRMRHSAQLYDTAQRLIFADQDLRKHTRTLRQAPSPEALVAVLRAGLRYPYWRARFELAE